MTDASSALIRIGPALFVAVVVLVIVAALVNRWSGAGLGRHTVFAAIRATVQLALLAGVLAAVLAHLWASLVFIVAMAVAAAWTSARRITLERPRVRQVLRCTVPVAAPSLIVVFVLVLLNVVPDSGIAIIPTAGILFGGAMTATSLAGRRAHDELRTRHGEVDAALALGFSERDARLEISRAAATSALIPGLDQTRSVGLVTIPGAFVGMVLGGSPTTIAAIMQLFVLVALLAVSAIAVVVSVEFVARQKI